MVDNLLPLFAQFLGVWTAESAAPLLRCSVAFAGVLLGGKTRNPHAAPHPPPSSAQVHGRHFWQLAEYLKLNGTPCAGLNGHKIGGKAE